MPFHEQSRRESRVEASQLAHRAPPCTTEVDDCFGHETIPCQCILRWNSRFSPHSHGVTTQCGTSGSIKLVLPGSKNLLHGPSLGHLLGSSAPQLSHHPCAEGTRGISVPTQGRTHRTIETMRTMQSEKRRLVMLIFAVARIGQACGRVLELLVDLSRLASEDMQPGSFKHLSFVDKVSLA